MSLPFCFIFFSPLIPCIVQECFIHIIYQDSSLHWMTLSLCS